ncbi:Bardet-Biedl syndrome 2 protein homolog isoform X3 [Bacillus rossius redtenbacheri]|uniref:Bardet-Biedl syndrome 2 protein homolog isoform X3 n=1 Tax=Bacillus rossius redtenbacheri TaxID=93214 RepID=UPI002FDE8964
MTFGTLHIGCLQRVAGRGVRGGGMSALVFTLSLQQQLLPGCVAVGCFDGTHCCLVAGCASDKVVVHSPHLKAGSAPKPQREVSLLNMAQPIRSLATGALGPDGDRDALVVGMATSVLAYDVHNNADLFYKEVADGANAVAVGRLGASPVPLALVGGNCSLQGFDHKGDDVFWSVTGDNVCSLALLDFDQDGQNELVVGSEDFDIRVFKNDHIVSELTETDAVTSLASFRNAVFGYGLANGTVGVYEQLQRLWRVKSKNTAAAVLAFDVDGDGVEELVTGWSNGKVDARSSRTGEVVFKDNVGDAVAGLARGDYRTLGCLDLLCCSVQGEVRGYSAQGQAARAAPRAPDQDAVRELLSRKQQLLLELRNYSGPDHSADREVGSIPAKTRLQTGISVGKGTDTMPPGVKITMATNNETIIRTVMVFAEGIFKGETYVVHPRDSEVDSKVDVVLYPPKNVAIDIHIKIALWINQHFLLPKEVEVEGPELRADFACVRTGTPVAVAMGSDGHLVVRTDDAGLAGEMLQSLASFLNLDHLQVAGEFRAEEARLEQLLERASALKDARLRLGADTAGHAGLVRSLVVRAEDARIVCDYDRMGQWYARLQELNGDLVRDYHIRLQNYQELVAAVRDVNAIVQRAANLRVGKHKTAVVSLCRQALKGQNVSSLVKIMRTGEA